MVRLTLLFVATIFAVAGWCEATFDASPGEAQASMDAMKAALTDAEKAELDAAVRVIDAAINSIMLEVQLLDQKASAVAKLAKMFLHGKTASEFVASADRACGVFHPNEFIVQMMCEKLREAENETATDTKAAVPARAADAASSSTAQGRDRPKVEERFRDCAECPQMVVVPAGSFLMGSPKSEEGRYDDEGPVHRVEIAAPFAVGVYEVTFAEWHACAADGGCGGYSPGDESWGREQRPVINVSWDDAQAYVGWLSEKTGKRYRLPSESEWEYVARAGTRTPFSTGVTISTEQANYDGNFTYGSGRKGVYRGETVPVGTFGANAWGLHDVHGNVWEWTEDCWNGSYAGAPADGSAWGSGDCSDRVLRGGAWSNEPGLLRSALRVGSISAGRGSNSGFRLARTLTP